MKRFILTVCLVTFAGLSSLLWAQDGAAKAKGTSGDYFKKQADLMDCGPPKYLLISEVDMEAGTLVGMSTVQGKSSVMAFHLSVKFEEVKFTNSKREPIADAELEKLKGKLVVMAEGTRPISNAYLRLFRDDTVVMSRLPTKSK